MNLAVLYTPALISSLRHQISHERLDADFGKSTRVTQNPKLASPEIARAKRDEFTSPMLWTSVTTGIG